MTCIPALILATLAFLGDHAAAQTIKPGLWESKAITSSSPEVQMALERAPQLLATLPPEQRRQLEATLAKQGVHVDAGTNGVVTRGCVTPAMAERKLPPAVPKGCTATLHRTEGARAFYRYTCQGGTTIDSVVTYRSDAEVHIAMTMSGGSGAASAPRTVETVGRFVASDCGELAPATAPK